MATSSPRHHAEIILAQLGLADVCGAIAAGMRWCGANRPRYLPVGGGTTGCLAGGCAWRWKIQRRAVGRQWRQA
ncbi:MAG: hypothetical protein M5U34_41745 [Chloroflexi bacterium]|nr:hypothetical protein [Chloroflexota bacterium]